MKNLIAGGVLAGLLLASAGLSAQTATTPETKKETAAAKSADRGSSGTITMEEYETLLKQYQEKNPGKTFQNMTKEEFETYLTTELAKLRKQRAEEAVQKEAQQKTAEPK